MTGPSQQATLFTSLGDTCRCGTRDFEHTPVLALPLPLSVTALVRMTKALGKVLDESDREAVFLTDGEHPTSVLYAVAKDRP